MGVYIVKKNATLDENGDKRRIAVSIGLLRTDLQRSLSAEGGRQDTKYPQCGGNAPIDDQEVVIWKSEILER